MKHTLLFSFFLLIVFNSYSQITFEGTPLSFSINKRSEIKEYTLPVVSNDSLRELYETEIPKRFAHAFQTTISSKKHGSWEFNENGDRIWRLKISSPTAHSLNFTFSEFNLPRGAKLYLYNSSKTQILGSLTSYNNSKTLSTIPISSESVIVEYNEPASVAFHANILITRIGHAFEDIYSNKQSRSTSCHTDVACSENQTAMVMKNSVCKIVFNNSSLCTGSLINNTNQDQTPYILTASHCFSDQKSAESAVFIFNYEDSDCNLNNAVEINSISGSEIVAADKNLELDVNLLKLSSTPPADFNPLYAGWNIEDKLLKTAFTIHHPDGLKKKYTYTDKQVTAIKYEMRKFVDMGHWHVSSWDIGVTDNGSSGSALFNSQGQIFGILSGGSSRCANPEGDDNFQRLSVAWDYHPETNKQLKAWLSPNAETKVLENLIPHSIKGNPISHFTPSDIATLFSFGEKAEGMWTGKNEIGFDALCTGFLNVENRFIYGVKFPVAKLTGDIENHKLVIWRGNNTPQAIVYEENLSSQYLSSNNVYNRQFEEAIETDGNFFIGIVYSPNIDDEIVLMAQKAEQSATSYDLLHRNGIWYKSYETGFKFHSAIEVYVKKSFDASEEFTNELQSISLLNNTINAVTPIELFEENLFCQFDTTSKYSIQEAPDDSGYWFGKNDYGVEKLTEWFYIENEQVISSIWLDVVKNESPSDNSILKIEIINDANSLIYEMYIPTSKLTEEYRNKILLETPIKCVKKVEVNILLDSITNPFALASYHRDSTVSTLLTVDGYVRSTKDYHLPEAVGIGFGFSYSPLYYSQDSIALMPIKKMSNYEYFHIKGYPSPTNSSITVSFFNNRQSEAVISIANLSGKVVYSEKFDLKQGHKVPLDVSGLNNGMYFIFVKTEDDVVSYKFCIDKNYKVTY